MRATDSIDQENVRLISTFHCGETMFGFDTNCVVEVVKPGKITRVCNAPEYLVGVTNLRGRIISVIDLAEKMGVGSILSITQSMMYIIDLKQEFVGVLVDSVGDAEHVSADEIRPVPENFVSIPDSMTMGVFQRESRLCVLINAENALAAEQKQLDL